MNVKQIRAWKKVFESDLDNIVLELREDVLLPSVVILTGEVGAGKTTLVNRFVRGDMAVSPTYSIINECENVAHGDFYRLKDPDEIIHLELPLYLEGKDYFLVEWGLDFIGMLKKEVDDSFNYYELKIEINESSDSSANQASRNYFLNEIKDI